MNQSQSPAPHLVGHAQGSSHRRIRPAGPPPSASEVVDIRHEGKQSPVVGIVTRFTARLSSWECHLITHGRVQPVKGKPKVPLTVFQHFLVRVPAACTGPGTATLRAPHPWGLLARPGEGGL